MKYHGPLEPARIAGIIAAAVPTGGPARDANWLVIRAKNLRLRARKPMSR